MSYDFSQRRRVVRYTYSLKKFRSAKSVKTFNTFHAFTFVTCF